MDVKALDSLISQLHAASALASGKTASAGAVQDSKSSAFGDLLKNSLDQVNGSQQNAERLARDFELGSSSVNLHEVMIATAKANIAFQATVQVRNKVVSAYHDIMSMQL
ncbi:MAG: flagellar hook-basal body complex protein FliE [Georgfuchsia sp.]